MQAFLILIIVLAIAGAVAFTGDRLIRAGARGFKRHTTQAAPERGRNRSQVDLHQRDRKIRLMGWRATVTGVLLGAIVSLVTWGAGAALVHPHGLTSLVSGSAVPLGHAVPVNTLVAAPNPLARVNPLATLPFATRPLATSHSPLRSTISSDDRLAQVTPNSSEPAPHDSNTLQNSRSQPNSAESGDGESQTDPLDRAEVAPVPQPSRWQRMQGFLFVFYILVLSGVIATVGDRLGYRIGKKRLTWFNLRPRHTAILVTILTGIFISASSVGVLLLTNQSIADALFNYTKRVTELQTEIQSLEGDITAVQTQLATLETERLEAENRVQQLTVEQAELRTLKAAVEEELAAANQSLETTQGQLNEAHASLDVARQETAQAEAAAADARERVAQLQVSLQSTEEELTTLQTQKIELEADIANLVAVAERLRRGEFAVLAGEPLATGVIEGGMTPGDIQQALNSLFAIAERRARTLGATPTRTDGRAIQIRVPEVTRVIQEVSTPGSWVVQVFSLTNRLVGEPVPVITGVIPNRLLFPEGTVLSETSISPGRTDEDIEETLVRLFLEAGQKSRN